MTATQAEADSLRRQILCLSEEVARVERTREKEISAKQTIIRKKANQQDKTEKALAKLKSERYELKESVRCLEQASQAKVHHTAQLQHEIKTLCAETDAAKERIKTLEEALEHQPGATLRLRIKEMCLKYHPDRHGSTTVNNVEVTRDLVELLAI